MTVANPPISRPSVSRVDLWSLVGNVIVFVSLLPVLAALGQSLGQSPSGYGWWWGTHRGWAILARTVGLSTVAAAVGTLAAWPIAVCASRASRRAALLVLVLSCLPLLVPSSLMGTAWIMALGRDAVITNALRRLLGDWPWTIYRMPVAAAAIGLRYVGIAASILAFECRRQTTSAAIERSFRLPLRARLTFLRIAPAIRPAAAVFLLLTLLVMNDHIMPGLFLITTYGTQVLIEYNALLDPGGAAALAGPLMLVGLILGAAVLRLGRPSLTIAECPLPLPPSAPVAPAVVAGGVLALAIGVPLVSLTIKAGSAQAVVHAAIGARLEILRTAGLALGGGALCAAAAAPVARAWEQGSSFAPAVLLTLAVPPSLLAIGTIALSDRTPLHAVRDSDLPLIAAYVARFLPIAVLATLFSWSRNRPASSAASAFGIPRRSSLLWLSLPIRGPAILAAGALSALLIATELEASVLLTPPGVTALGVRLYSLIHTAPDAVVSALALATLGVVLIPVLAGAGVVTILAARRANPWS